MHVDECIRGGTSCAGTHPANAGWLSYDSPSPLTVKRRGTRRARGGPQLSLGAYSDALDPAPAAHPPLKRASRQNHASDHLMWSSE